MANEVMSKPAAAMMNPDFMGSPPFDAELTTQGPPGLQPAAFRVRVHSGVIALFQSCPGKRAVISARWGWVPPQGAGAGWESGFAGRESAEPVAQRYD